MYPSVIWIFIHKVEYDECKPVPSKAAQTCEVSRGAVQTLKRDCLGWARYAPVLLPLRGVQWPALVWAAPSAAALAKSLLWWQRDGSLLSASWEGEGRMAAQWDLGHLCGIFHTLLSVRSLLLWLLSQKREDWCLCAVCRRVACSIKMLLKPFDRCI